MIFNNTYIGVFVDSSRKHNPDIRYNWWGDDSGPGGGGPGKGDNVTEGANFNPWLSEDGGEVWKEDEEKEDEESRSILPLVIVCIGLGGVGGLAFLKEDFRIALIGIGLLPLYSRLQKEDLMESEKRSVLYNHILANPGVNYSTLLKEMEYGNGTLCHHLNSLERNDIIRRKKEFCRVYYFPTGTLGFAASQSIDRPLSSNQKAILYYLKKSESVTSREIETGCSMSQSSVNYSLSQLVKDGRVQEIADEGGTKEKRYRENID